MSWFMAFFNLQPEEWIAVATIALVVVTALLALIAYRQVITTRRQLRAYLAVDPGYVVRQSKRQGLELQPIISNAGNTPAYEVRSRSQIAVLPIPLPKSTKLTLPPFHTSVSTLGPRQSRVVTSVSIRLNFAQLRAIAKGDAQRIYIYGRLEYYDAFQSPRWLFRLTPRYTNFCYSVSWHPNRKNLWRASERHNESN